MRGRWSEFVTGLAVLDFSSQRYFFFGDVLRHVHSAMLFWMSDIVAGAFTAL